MYMQPLLKLHALLDLIYPFLQALGQTTTTLTVQYFTKSEGMGNCALKPAINAQECNEKQTYWCSKKVSIMEHWLESVIVIIKVV